MNRAGTRVSPVGARFTAPCPIPSRPIAPGTCSPSPRRRGGWGVRSLLVLIALLLPAGVRAQEPERPVVDGIALERTSVVGVDLYYDSDVDAETVQTASAAIVAALTDVPELTGLPTFTTPIRAFILADDERFRLALAEIANVRTELVADDISGYTIERDGTMLVFFAGANVAEPASALLGYSHELAHLAVREATQRRAAAVVQRGVRKLDRRPGPRPTPSDRGRPPAAARPVCRRVGAAHAQPDPLGRPRQPRPVQPGRRGRASQPGVRPEHAVRGLPGPAARTGGVGLLPDHPWRRYRRDAGLRRGVRGVRGGVRRLRAIAGAAEGRAAAGPVRPPARRRRPASRPRTPRRPGPRNGRRGAARRRRAQPAARVRLGRRRAAD